MGRLRPKGITVWFNQDEFNRLNLLVELTGEDKSNLIRRLLDQEYRRKKSLKKAKKS